MLKIATERQGRILEIVREEGFASIEHLARQFDVTQQTVRRVVNQLCDQGLLRRIHGGVSLPVQNQNLAYGSRQGLNADAKRRIAHAVSNFIPDGASLMIGLGTTPEYVAQALSNRQDLRVITNNLNVAAAFAQNPDIEITIAGGTLRPLDRDIVGDAAVRFFLRLQGRFRNLRRRRHRSGRHPARFSFGRSSGAASHRRQLPDRPAGRRRQQIRPQRHGARRPSWRLPSFLHRQAAAVGLSSDRRTIRGSDPRREQWPRRRCVRSLLQPCHEALGATAAFPHTPLK